MMEHIWLPSPPSYCPLLSFHRWKFFIDRYATWTLSGLTGIPLYIFVNHGKAYSFRFDITEMTNTGFFSNIVRDDSSSVADSTDGSNTDERSGVLEEGIRNRYKGKGKGKGIFSSAMGKLYAGISKSVLGLGSRHTAKATNNFDHNNLVCEGGNSSVYSSDVLKKIMLKSSDGEVFEVEEEIALQSQTIKHVIEDDCADGGIPLPNVTGKILAKVIEYCKKHTDGDKEELKNWDVEFVKVDQATLFDLILAANYLKVKDLLDLTCQTVADMIKGKTPEEIRKTYNTKNFTPEEEEEIRRENQWAFE